MADYTRLMAAAAAAATLGFLGWMGWSALGPKDADIFAECRGSQVGGGAIGGPFTLIDKTGKTVTDAEILTKPTLIYFGYTFCPDVCPMDMAHNAEAADILEESGHDVNVVFISVDPGRDTPEVVGEFAANIHPRAIGLTGSEEQVAAAANAYRAYFKKQEAEDEFYMVDHSAFTYLVLPGHGFVEFFKHDLPGKDRARATSCFLDIAARAN